MSHSGNRRLRQLSGTTKEGEPLYNPSVFRYKCIGYLNLNSEDKGSPGICRGYESSLERVANMVPDTRDGALKKFLDASADLGTYVDSDESSDQKVKEIYTARTLIYKDDAAKKWDEQSSRIKKHKPSILAEDELINKTEWSCWGSTSIHYLVLDPIQPKRSKSQAKKITAAEVEKKADEDVEDMLTSLKKQLKNLDKSLDKDLQKRKREILGKVASKDSKVSAITPENIGVSIRRIDSSVGHFTVTDIGSIRICVETSGSTIGSNSQQQTPGNDQKNDSDATAPSSTELSKQQEDANNKKSSPSSALLDPKKFYAFTLKVGKQMQYNVKELREAVQEDFPGRSYRFGTKVVTRMEQTTKQTFEYMGKILDSWWKSL